MPYACRWAQLPSAVVLAVCQRLSARHLKELKDSIKVDAKYIGKELDSMVIDDYDDDDDD